MLRLQYGRLLGPFDEADEKQQDNRANGGVNNGRDDAAADRYADSWKNQPCDECPHDTNHNIADQSKTVPQFAASWVNTGIYQGFNLSCLPFTSGNENAAQMMTKRVVPTTELAILGLFLDSLCTESRIVLKTADKRVVLPNVLQFSARKVRIVFC
jgi:hypothetical protein